MTEHVERFGDVIEREGVCDQRTEIHATSLDRRHQAAHALLAARAERRDNLLVAKPRVESFVRRDDLA